MNTNPIEGMNGSFFKIAYKFMFENKKNRQRVEQTEQLQATQTGCGQGDEKKVFDFAPTAVTACPTATGQLAGAINRGAKGTDPATEKTPEQSRQHQQDQRRPQRPTKIAWSEQICKGRQRIDTEQQTHRVRKLIQPLVLRLYEQPEKTEHAEQLDRTAHGDLGEGDFHTICIRFRSITPRPRFAPATTVGISSGR